MANEKQVYTESFIAGEDLSEKQYYGVKLSADRTVVMHTETTDRPIGVLLNAPESGQEALVLIIGRCPVITAAALTYGQAFYFDGDGKAAAFTIATDITKYNAGVIVVGNDGGDEYAEAIIDCVNPMKGSAST